MSEQNDEHPTESECVVCKQNLLWGFWLFVRFSLGFASTVMLCYVLCVMNVFSVLFLLSFLFYFFILFFLLSSSLELALVVAFLLSVFSDFFFIFIFIFRSFALCFSFVYDFTALLDGPRFRVRSLLCALTLSVHCLLF